MHAHQHYPLSLRALGAIALLTLPLSLTACPGGGGNGDSGVTDSGATSLIPADYRTRFTVVRNCRNTTEHTNPTLSTTHPLGATNIIVYINPESAAAYQANANPLPANTLVIKEEHDATDCSHILGSSVMRKEAGFDSAHGDWHWQHVTPTGSVDQDGIVPGCIGSASCHTASACTPRDFMCTLP